MIWAPLFGEASDRSPSRMVDPAQWANQTQSTCYYTQDRSTHSRDSLGLESDMSTGQVRFRHVEEEYNGGDDG